jgi:nucleoside-diphosphate-sugar epimerase
MKVLIFGGTGFVGLNIAPLCWRAGTPSRCSIA